MEITKPAVAAAAALCLVVGAGAAHLLRSNPDSAAADSAALAPGVETSEALVTAPATETLPAAPASIPAPPTRVPGQARTARVRPAPATAPAPLAAKTETPRASEPARDAAAAPAPLPRVDSASAADAASPASATPLFEELVVSADSVIGLEVDTTLSSDRARVEDAVVAEVTRDVKVGSRVAIPSGAKAHGEVTFVERGGRLKDRARLGVRFTSIVLADGTRVPIETDTIVREGSSPGAESSAKIGGGALGGAILGGILGGAKGAIIGGSAGAGAGTAAVLAGGRNAATLNSGTPVTVRLVQPATITVEK